MIERRQYKTRTGATVTDSDIERLADDADKGYAPDEIIARRGRPPMGSGPAAVVPVRLDPELQAAAQERADADATPLSAVIRAALRRYLDVA